jgi:hypothetical protein
MHGRCRCHDDHRRQHRAVGHPCDVERSLHPDRPLDLAIDGIGTLARVTMPIARVEII